MGGGASQPHPTQSHLHPHHPYHQNQQHPNRPHRNASSTDVHTSDELKKIMMSKRGENAHTQKANEVAENPWRELDEEWENLKEWERRLKLQESELSKQTEANILLLKARSAAVLTELKHKEADEKKNLQSWSERLTLAF
eukprot:TRINITY_DN4381_c0_g2_i1.p1 TRINITY_DN4381_c0_g2~~TRINITY_DN4381_c0_g2_i1.p1  ORF type:complete len:140 (-),score=35.66 TRINITY_DN4381_c0_g2_i1:43-462(-)